MRRVLPSLLRCLHAVGYEASICEEIQIWKLRRKKETVFISRDGRERSHRRTIVFWALLSSSLPSHSPKWSDHCLHFYQFSFNEVPCHRNSLFPQNTYDVYLEWQFTILLQHKAHWKLRGHIEAFSKRPHPHLVTFSIMSFSVLWFTLRAEKCNIYWRHFYKRNFRFPPRSSWELRSSALLRSE